MENAADRGSTRIEIRLINKGSMGFDIIDDGEGIEESQIPSLNICLSDRREN